MNYKINYSHTVKSKKLSFTLTHIKVIYTSVLMLLSSYLFSQVQDTGKVKTTADTTNSKSLPKVTSADSSKINKSSVSGFPKTVPANTVVCYFKETEINLDGLMVISNLLKICNTTANSVSVTITLKKPSFWRSLLDEKKVIELKAGDTIYLPVRLISSGSNIKSGTKYTFTALLKNLKTFEISKSQFYALKPKLSKLKLSVEPGKTVYFLNKKNSTHFNLNLSNESDHDERLLIKLSEAGKDIYVNDSAKTFNDKKFNDYSLKAYSDTNIIFNAYLNSNRRNFKRVDTYGFNQFENLEAKRTLLFVKGYDLQTPVTTKTKLKDGKDTIVNDVFKIGKTVQIIKLNDTKKVNSTDNSKLPLTLVANAFNFFNYQPSLNLQLFGNARFEKNATLGYYLQNNFNYYSYSRRTTQSTFGQIIYDNNRFTAMVGNAVRLSLPLMPLGSQVSGTGVSGTYKFKYKQYLGFALSRNGQNFNNFTNTNISVGYGGVIKDFKYALTYLNTSYTNGNSVNLVSTNVFLPAIRKHRLSFFASYYLFRFFNTQANGQQYGFNYSVQYFKNKAYTNLNAIYSSIPANFNNPIFNTVGSNARFNAQLNNVFRQNKHYFNLTNRLIVSPTFSPSSNTLVQNVFNFNDFLYSKMTDNTVRYTPGAYFNYVNLFNQKVIGGGLIFNVISNNIDENFKIGLNTRAGYNKVISNKSLPNFFTAQVNFLTSYKVFRFNVRYMYGPQFFNNISNVLTANERYSQIVFTNLSHQYQFKNKKFVLENTVFYNYINKNRRSGVGTFTQLFYFTKNGWNFNAGFNFNYNVSDAFLYTNAFNSQNVTVSTISDERRENFAYQFSIGLKKDFSIPLPKKLVNKKCSNVLFKTFLDINGNRIFDKEDIIVSNVVIKVNNDEVQTNEKGEATLINLPLGKHPLTVFPVDKIDAWFSVIKDSIDNVGQPIVFVPFSKGAEISGNVELERTEISKGFVKNLDISRFRIILSDSAGFVYNTLTDKDGKFMFHVPFGKYTLHFNEKLLGNDFSLNENYVEIDLKPGESSYYHTFLIIEKAKKIKKKKFDADGNLIDDGTDK